jgi:hypothetical protein
LFAALIDERIRAEFAAHAFDTSRAEYFTHGRASKICDGVGGEKASPDLPDRLWREIDRGPSVLLGLPHAKPRATGCAD